MTRPRCRLLPFVCLALGAMQTGCRETGDSVDLQRGMESLESGNFDQAVAALSRHLRKRPTDAEAFTHRGVARNATGDIDGALADFDSALNLNPGLVRASLQRGIARKKRGDLNGALEDFDSAIELEPKNSQAYYYRANIRTGSGDLDGAIADYTRSMQFESRNGLNYFNRGIAHYLRRDWEKARRDFDTAGRQEDPQPYGSLYSHVLRVRIGDGEQARTELRANLQARGASKPGDWFLMLASFLLGDIDEEALLAAASEGGSSSVRDKRCEACYFAGMVRLVKGERAAATECFRQSIAMRRQTFAEHLFAKAELEALEDPARTTPERPPIAPPRTLRGSVYAVGEESLSLRVMATGSVQKFSISRETRVTLDGRNTSIQQIKPAMNAQVIVDTNGTVRSIDATGRK